MVTMKQPEPFTFEGKGDRAVLLLHGFTGHSADVRMMGRFLASKGYTAHAPIYRGHGKTPDDIVASNSDEWWEDVQAAYQYLKDKGYEKIAVAGLSLGGVLSLKLAYSYPVKGVVTMCSPMFFDNETQLNKGFKLYARQHKQLQGKDNQAIEQELAELMEAPATADMFQRLGAFITDVSKHVDEIYAPLFVVQATEDQMINTDSANFIYEHAESDLKEIKWYENSSHVITMGKEKEQLHEDVYQFLESLDWE
ncbi:alpha/beta hydrolase [Terribacillus saccharophilus]|uniref:Carboxylesterase n=1 Tax=Terribacillus saccharophilus TaxID=361277 RepID=A0A268AFF2_9BACI|nr:alpha/beta fold hydrolase [Terribacillus saccharophilus]PAD22853.1 carboxylesterase [Terribacillus saccharophilus]PAF17894.1 carboxylesterase [Terribacillus saccharophilus]PAF22808.1 carboxylesterase [Terribacillus saccharophilus]PAF34494.1 carboxylesterase [Terribacillus saccharophilus]PAF37432.1 carboxylesterase [Terribacillus saccharophilus]